MALSRINYLLIFFLGSTSLLFSQLPASEKSQTVEKTIELNKAGSQRFGSSVVVYGLCVSGSETFLNIRRFDLHLKAQDSLQIKQKGKPEDYLQLWSDTLHGFLNIYLQQTDKKQVSIFRFTKKHELHATIENVDVARLNSISGFENELFYFKNTAYTIKTEPDSGGKQFYLNKYTLTSDLKNFEYTLTWQFPFERKNIRSAHIFYADRKQVLLYVNLSGQDKRGQWILKLDAVKGQLLRGIKLNERDDNAVYEFGNFIMDTTQKLLRVTGQKFTGVQWKEDAPQPSVGNAAFAFLYLIGIDSLNEINARDEFKIPIQEIKTGMDKSSSSYILRISKIQKKEDKLILETDLFRSKDNLKTFFYVNSTLLTLTLSEEEITLEKNTLVTNLLIEKFYTVPDPLDLNGKLFNDSSGLFEKLYYKSLTFPVKTAFKRGDDGNTAWLLKKSYPKKNTVNFSLLAPVNKIYKLNSIADLPKSSEPFLIPLSESSFLMTDQMEETKFRTVLREW